jgi:hypothetical protein
VFPLQQSRGAGHQVSNEDYYLRSRSAGEQWGLLFEEQVTRWAMRITIWGAGHQVSNADYYLRSRSPGEQWGLLFEEQATRWPMDQKVCEDYQKRLPGDLWITRWGAGHRWPMDHNVRSFGCPEPEFLNFEEPRNRFQEINSASLYSLAGQYHNTIPTRFLVPHRLFKNSSTVPSLASDLRCRERERIFATGWGITFSWFPMMAGCPWLELGFARKKFGIPPPFGGADQKKIINRVRTWFLSESENLFKQAFFFKASVNCKCCNGSSVLDSEFLGLLDLNPDP